MSFGSVCCPGPPGPATSAEVVAGGERFCLLDPSPSHIPNPEGSHRKEAPKPSQRSRMLDGTCVCCGQATVKPVRTLPSITGTVYSPLPLRRAGRSSGMRGVQRNIRQAREIVTQQPRPTTNCGGHEYGTQHPTEYVRAQPPHEHDKEGRQTSTITKRNTPPRPVAVVCCTGQFVCWHQ